MNGPTDNITIDFTPVKGHTVAYTLNNAQPVRCTLVGEDPIFFMDSNTEALEDEGIFDLALLESLTSELDGLQKKVASYDALAKEFQREEGHTQKLFASECDAFGSENNVTETSDINVFLTIVRKSRILSTLLDFVAERNIEIKWSVQSETADYDRQGAQILLNPNLETSNQILLLGAQLRQVWQHKQGVAIDPMAFYPDHGVLINRLQAADLSLFMIRAAWELQLAGEKSVWEMVENSALCDLGRAFAREVTHDFRTLNNGRAGLAVIESWFLSERCRKHDRTFIQRMLAGPVEGGFNSSEDISRQATLTLMSKLGDTPYGQNYLSGHVASILEDPIFYEVRDRSNANFLWFIKFENSFNEAEKDVAEKQGLQKTLSSNAEKGETHEGEISYTQGQTSEIIAFPRQTKASDKVNNKAMRKCASKGGTILPFGQL